MNFGYTVESLDRTVEPFCEGQIFIDNYGDTNVPAFTELCKTVSNSDQVVIPSITCLGYSFSQVCERWKKLREKGVKIYILDFPALQTNEKNFDQIIEYLHHSEQTLRSEKQRNGIMEAQKKGVHVGRKPKSLPAYFDEYCLAYKEKRISSREAAQKMGISHTTFLRWYKERFLSTEGLVKD